jgi:CHAD domain-containing protein
VSELSVDELSRRVITSELANWMKFDPSARDGSDPEGVHQLRVTSRRLRAELDVLAGVFSPKDTQALSTELQWIGRILGRQRDLDVLHDLMSELEHDESPFDSGVFARLRRQRDAERARVRDTLSHKRYRRLVAELSRWAVAPPLRGRRQHARDVLRPKLLKGLTSLLERVDALGPNAPDDQLHALRIEIKRNRYRAEVAAHVLGPNADFVAKDLAKAQGVLGDLHDCVVASDFLRAWSLSRWPVDAEEQGRGPIDAALEDLSRRMDDLRTAWRAPLTKARRRSTALYLEPDASTEG